MNENRRIALQAALQMFPGGAISEHFFSFANEVADFLEGNTPGTSDAPAPKVTTRKPKAQPEPEQPTHQEATDDEDAELQRELNEPVEPAPETAKAVVDAGTGQPIAPQGDEPIKMTKDDVRAAAGKLAAKDAGQLAAILKKYGAAKLSEVADDKLGDFASDVIEALG